MALTVRDIQSDLDARSVSGNLSQLHSGLEPLSDLLADPDRNVDVVLEHLSELKNSFDLVYFGILGAVDNYYERTQEFV